jgi:hypothetical protein
MCLCAYQALLENMSGYFSSDGDPRYDDLVNSAVSQLGNDRGQKEIFLDAVTVLHGRNAEIAITAWRVNYKNAPLVFHQLVEHSLVKVVNGQLWVHDVIRSIAVRQAYAANQLCMTRIWLADQASA